MIKRMPKCEIHVSCDPAVVSSRDTVQVGGITYASVCALFIENTPVSISHGTYGYRDAAKLPVASKTGSVDL